MRLLGVILNIFVFFLQENFTHTKSIKSIKKHKNVKQATFFLLDVFYEHKKAYKTLKSDFLPLRCFL